MDNVLFCWLKDEEDGLGVSNRGVDVIFNELYGGVEQSLFFFIGIEVNVLFFFLW